MLPECKQSTSSCEIKLRELEIDSYSRILSVFRARGNLTNERRKLLKQIGSFLNISQERHRAEVRRVTNDEVLSSIASRLTGQDWTIDWHEEGKRIVPTPTPFSNFTVNTPFADYIASVASLGKKYVDLYNKKICDSVPNKEKTVEIMENKCKNTSEKWLDDISKVFSSVQKERSKDVSIQTIKKKVIPKACTYCQRRKELRKKKLEVKVQGKATDKPEVAGEKSEARDSSIMLPSGKQIVVENAFSDNLDDLSVSIIAQEVVVETEPIAGPSHRQELDVRLGLGSIDSSTVPLATPDFTGLTLESQDCLDPAALQYMNIFENSEKPLPPRIPRILNSGPRKKLKKHSVSHPMKHSSVGDRSIRKKGQDMYKETNSSRDTACMLMGHAPVRFSKPPQVDASSTRLGYPKYQNTSSFRTGEGLQRYQDCHSKAAIPKSQESYVKHFVGVLRQQEVLSKRYEESSKLHDSVTKHHEVTFKQHEDVTNYQENILKQHEAVLKHQGGSLKYDSVSKVHQDPFREPLRHHEAALKQQENNALKPPGGIYKHYVRVRHTPKADKPYQEVSAHHTDQQSTSTLQFGENVEVPFDYLQSHRPDLFDNSMEVVEINDFKMETGHSLPDNQQSRESITIGSLDSVLHDHPSSQHHMAANLISTDTPDTLVEGILIPSSQDPSINTSEGRSSGRREEFPSRKIIKIFNGEKKVHGTIHFRTDQMKDMINRLPNTQFSQVEVNNGCQVEESANIVWDGASLSGSEFIMEDVRSIVDETSCPVVNGHEEMILEEEVLAGSQIIETLVDKSEVCVIPQTDMKFSVVDLSDYTGPIEHIHSVSSQSKDDSRDSDILINRP